MHPREGDERLSEGQDGESHGSRGDRQTRTNRGANQQPRAADKTKKKQRTGDLGRALRTDYDDTLRESVPDEVLNLHGKLS